MSLPDWASACRTAVAIPPQQGTTIFTTVTLRMRMDPGGASIVASHLECEGKVPGISAEAFEAAAAKAKDTCPVSRLLKPGLEKLTHTARLVP